MSDPLDKPPTDHGSDRYGYAEICCYKGEISEMFELEPWVLAVLDHPCPDCNPNVFFHYIGPDGGALDRENFDVRIAHDEGCPTLARIEAGD